MKILVVDDEIMLIGLMELMLSDYEVVGATNGREAVEKYREWRPDMVLMDIMMPLMDGIEATREILKMDRNAKVLAVTACANGKSKEIMEAGALEIIDKPFTRELLGNTIKKYLKQAPDKLQSGYCVGYQDILHYPFLGSTYKLQKTCLFRHLGV